MWNFWKINIIFGKPTTNIMLFRQTILLVTATFIVDGYIVQLASSQTDTALSQWVTLGYINYIAHKMGKQWLRDELPESVQPHCIAAEYKQLAAEQADKYGQNDIVKDKIL